MAEVANENFLRDYDIDLVTESDSKPYYLKWTMKNFSKFPINEEFASIPFRPTPDCEWRLYFKKGVDQLFLYLENQLEEEITAKCCLKIMTSNGKRVCYGKNTSNFSHNVKKDILGSVRAIYQVLNILRDDILIFVCSFTVIREFTTKSSIPENVDIPRKYDGLLKLAEDLRTFCIDKQHVDFTLKLNDGEMSVNKAILGARSPVFNRMFMHKMYEQENSTAKIDDVTFTVMKKLVDFLYTGNLNVESDYDSAAALYYAADKYEVLDLRKMCADTLMSLVTDKNITETLVIADGHGDEDLKNQALTFLCSNMRDVVKSGKWDEFVSSETKFAAEVIKYYSKTILTY